MIELSNSTVTVRGLSEKLQCLLMSLSTELLEIHSKVAELCALCQIATTLRDSATSNREIAQKIINDLNKSINWVAATKDLENQYKKLEESIQKKESDIRKHIGLQQQLKLYSESLQQQLNESEFARSEFIQKTRKMLSDLKRSNHFLHEQNLHLKQQISVCHEDEKTRKKAFNIDVDLKKHMRTESSKDHIQKTPSKHKFTNAYSYNKKSELLKTKLDMRELLSSVERKREIQRKIKQLNEKKTIDEYKSQKLNSNSSYHELKDNMLKKSQTRNSVRKSNNSKKSYADGEDDATFYEKIEYKTRSIQKKS